MLELWWILALAASLVRAIFSSINQFYKMSGQLVIVYRGLGVALLSFPLLFFYSPLPNWQFYAYCIIQGFAVAFSDYRLFRAVKTFGAEISGTFVQLSVAGVFILWLAVTPSQFVELARQPWTFIGVILCLTGSLFAALSQNKSKIGHHAVVYLLPVILSLTVGGVLNKKALEYGVENLSSAVVYYIFITGVICGLCHFLMPVSRRATVQDIFTPKNIREGLVIALVAIALVATKNVAIYYVSNPAYVAAVIMLYPLWVSGWMMFQRDNETYPRLKFYVVAIQVVSVIGLVLLQ